MKTDPNKPFLKFDGNDFDTPLEFLLHSLHQHPTDEVSSLIVDIGTIATYYFMKKDEGKIEEINIVPELGNLFMDVPATHFGASIRLAHEVAMGFIRGDVDVSTIPYTDKGGEDGGGAKTH